MADVITRLKLESGEYDSKIKRAVTGLQRMEDECRKVGGTLAILEKDQKEYVQSLGRMQTVSTSVRGKIGELSSAFVELRSQYNRLTDEEKKGDFGKALSGNLDQLKTRVQAAKQELKDIQKELDGGSNTSGGGFLSGDKLSGMLQVFGGNLMTKGFDMAVGTATSFASEIGDCVKQGIELAKQGEGIRIAFARLGRGDILEGLREATHGTVTDLELMKAAVKFNDFKLPIEELGTMLAFAQQKAKDTGQSVDYMVDSIVTGLGRKSLLILDNLGLSASEIRERMKETGDMTTAVGAIIREQMAKAGDYVETAADRAAQANVNLQNKLEEVGRKFAPIEEASTQLWTSMKLGILEVVSGPLSRLLNMLTDAGKLRNTMNDMAGGDSNTETDKQIGFLQKTSAGNRRKRYEKQIAIYNAEEAKEWKLYRQKKAEYEANGGYAAGYGTDMYEDHRKKALSWQMFRLNYQQRAQGLLTSNKPLPPSSDTNTIIPTPKTGKGGTTTVKELTEQEKLQKQINELVAEGMTMDEQGRTAQRTKIADLQAQLDTYKEIENELRGIEKKEVKTTPEKPYAVDTFSEAPVSESSISAYMSAIKQGIQQSEVGSDIYNALTEQLNDTSMMSDIIKMAIEGGVKGADLSSAAQELKDALLDGDISEDEIQKILDQINKAIGEEEFHIKLTADGNLTTVGKENIKQAQEMTDKWQKASSAINTVSSAMQSLEDPAAKVIGIIAQAIATIALSYAQASLMAAKNPLNAGWGWIAFAATGAATMISSIAAIHSATGYAQGGIVKGNSYSGDNVGGLVDGSQLVGLNAGEVVLTRAMAGNLASQLSDNGLPATQGGQPYVTGEMLFLAMNNYGRRTGRGEIVMSRR